MEKLTKHARLFNMRNELSCLSLNDGKTHMYFSHGTPIGMFGKKKRFVVKSLGVEHKENVRKIQKLYDNNDIKFIDVDSFLKILE